MVATKADSDQRIDLVLQYVDDQGISHTNQTYWELGTIVDSTRRAYFEDAATGSITEQVDVYLNRPLTLQVTAKDIQSVEYGSTVQDALVWQQDPQNPSRVTITLQYPAAESGIYFYAVVTHMDGTQSAAFVAIKQRTVVSSLNSYLPNGQTLGMGEVLADGSYNMLSDKYANREDSVSTGKLYVLYETVDYGVPEYWPSNNLVESVEVTADNDAVTIMSQGVDNGMTFFEYQWDRSQYGRSGIKVTATLQDGSTRESILYLNVVEEPVHSNMTVTNSEELTQALQSAMLLPGTVIQLKDGIYQGSFVCNVPCTLQGQGGNVVLQGSLNCTAENVRVSGIQFKGDGRPIALRNAQSVTNSSFTDYEVALEMCCLGYDTASFEVFYNTFENNGTALQVLDRNWCLYLQNNTFVNNDTAVEFAIGSVLDGSYSLAYDCNLSIGSMNRNSFYLGEGQKAVDNNAYNGVTANFTYNYYEYTAEDGSVSKKPEAAMFDGPVLYSPYYSSTSFDGVETDESLEDNVDETGTSSITLVGAQNSSNSNTADSSLQLSGSKFEELRDSEVVDAMEVTVKSTSGETDIVWSFDSDALREDYDGSSVNLGVAFTFTDFEYDMVNNIVKKSTESTEIDPETGEYVSETMESIAYQAMCFSHSGPLPGTATVKVRMNESLLEYYATHNNSLEGFKVYYLNADTGKLELMDKPLTVVLEDGVYFYTLEIDHCSSYIVTDVDLDTEIVGFVKILLGDDVYQLVDNMLTRLPEGASVTEVLSHLTGGVMTVLNQSGEKVAEGEAVGTGYTIGLGDGTVGQITAVVAGDLDGNSRINMQDLVTMQRAMLNMQQLEGAYLKAAIPASGNASGPRMNDLVLLRRYLLRLTPSMYE